MRHSTRTASPGAHQEGAGHIVGLCRELNADTLASLRLGDHGANLCAARRHVKPCWALRSTPGPAGRRVQLLADTVIAQGAARVCPRRMVHLLARRLPTEGALERALTI